MSLAVCRFPQEGRKKWRRTLITRQRLFRLTGLLCERLNVINAAPRFIRSPYSNRICRATVFDSAGSMPRSESCNTPSLTCAILPKLCCELLRKGKLSSTSPALAPTCPGSSLPFHPPRFIKQVFNRLDSPSRARVLAAENGLALLSQRERSRRAGSRSSPDGVTPASSQAHCPSCCMWPRPTIFRLSGFVDNSPRLNARHERKEAGLTILQNPHRSCNRTEN